jgi:beta-phosphoglucomutase
MQLKAVVFDLDGVITSSSREHFLAWAALARRLGRTLSPYVYDEVKGRSRMASLDIVLHDIGMAERFSESEKKALADEKNRIYAGMISKFDEGNLAPGATALFGLLKENGVRIALGSVSRNARMLLINMKIAGWFDYIADPDAIANPKPAPDIFIAAPRYFGFAPELCLGIEDAPAGIEAIKAAGMYAVGIGDEKALAGADIVYRELRDVDIFRIDKEIGRG